MTLEQKATKGIVWSIAQKWGMQVISFVTFLLLSRLLEPKAFGLVAMATVFTAFIEIFMDQGFSDAIVQRKDLEPEHLDTAFWTSVLSGILLAGIAIAIAKPIAGLFQEPQLVPVIMWLALSLPIDALSSTQKGILRREIAFKSLTIRSLASAFVGGIVGVSMAFSGFGVWSLVTQTLVQSLVATLVLWRVSNWVPGFRFSKKHFHDLFSFGFNVVGIKILEVVNRRFDDFLIGYFLGPIALGYYTIAYRIISVIFMLLTGVTTQVAFPTFSRMQHEPIRIRNAFYQVTQYTSLISFPIFLAVAALSPELVALLFGAKWSASVPIMQILSLIGILFSISYFNNSVIKATGQPAWLFKIMLLNTICNVLGFLAVVRLGIVAVAGVLVAIGYLLYPTSLWLVHKLIKIDFKTYLLQFAAPLISSAFMLIAIFAVKTIATEIELPYRLFIYISIGFLSYVMMILLTARTLIFKILELARLAFQK
ncbi:MOP flippase family protein [Tolypothrix sp. FACHB-123]|uniref:MOP flippase family protein n=1 Tax=Tolypothrix sp. FACHB-123 TaxID=2692868 RepID=UPI0016869D41|nr:MOP flippase family protein [Tolypothrix sp. FACHB-123]MBD2355855.1 MOP flippase family protein [Tolypothrix sp. FACHB-123]